MTEGRLHLAGGTVPARASHAKQIRWIKHPVHIKIIQLKPPHYIRNAKNRKFCRLLYIICMGKKLVALQESLMLETRDARPRRTSLCFNKTAGSTLLANSPLSMGLPPPCQRQGRGSFDSVFMNFPSSSRG